MTTIAGIHDVRLALETRPGSILEIRVDRARDDKRMRALLALAERHALDVVRVDGAELDRRAGGARHQGVVARLSRGTVRERPARRGSPSSSSGSRAARTPTAAVRDLPHPALVLALDGVQDPRNLGACMRCAEAAGVDALIVPRREACGLTPVASRVAAGAAHSLPWFRVGNLGRALEELKTLGLWIVGAADDADVELWEVDFRAPCALVLGAEGRGLGPLTRRRCDRVVRIPMAGVVESLNVSVAAGVLLFEAVRQRRANGP